MLATVAASRPRSSINVLPATHVAPASRAQPTRLIGLSQRRRRHKVIPRHVVQHDVVLRLVQPAPRQRTVRPTARPPAPAPPAAAARPAKRKLVYARKGIAAAGRSCPHGGGEGGGQLGPAGGKGQGRAAQELVERRAVPVSKEGNGNEAGHAVLDVYSSIPSP